MYGLSTEPRNQRARATLVALCGLAALAALLAAPTLATATAPGPPNVEVVPPAVIHTDRGDEPVTFVPGQITFTFSDGSTSECVIDPVLPPNPCREVTR
jgi:hypothetical protein